MGIHKVLPDVPIRLSTMSIMQMPRCVVNSLPLVRPCTFTLHNLLDIIISLGWARSSNINGFAPGLCACDVLLWFWSVRKRRAQEWMHSSPETHSYLNQKIMRGLCLTFFGGGFRKFLAVPKPLNNKTTPLGPKRK